MLNALLSLRAQNWFARPDCPARPIIEHICQRGFFRDAQIEAIKTYLFLKIEGGNRPLWQLFCDGEFTPDENLSRLHINQQTREVLENDSAARALFAFARSRADGAQKTLLPDLETYLLEHIGDIDCQSVVRKIFCDVAYPDYLFSLPMGAGKTFLMAAFIMLDLYFAQNEPENPVWAHNFILLVPSGLKSSILPSLKTIENFDATCVLPEPAASNVKKLMRFEMLDQAKTGSKKTQIVNPNAQKINEYQPFETLMGLVMVTNAEKVVLDRTQLSAQGTLIELSDDDKDRHANELRNLIGKIPQLQILIDEVHHAATDDIKLRQVVNSWSASGNINGVLGFSGTPYLSAPEKVMVGEGMAVKFAQITNTVFYYPLTRAIETFLKKPTVRTLSDSQPAAIVRRGVEEFLAHYGDVVYQGGQTAKLAIYCGTIERLESEIAPLLLEMGLSADEVLKYHRGNKEFAAPTDAESEWKILDTHLSKKRVILLVQIGKEGWDCRSLTGVILSQKGDCPTNMVLQTSCRCLRQMDGIAPDGSKESAGIWLNADNAKTLDKQLKEEQHTSIAELNQLGSASEIPMRPRVARTTQLQLPPVDFYQMRVHFDEPIIEDAQPYRALTQLQTADFRRKAEQIVSGLQPTEEISRRFLDDERGEVAEFNAWLLHIVKGSFGALSLDELRAFVDELRPIFAAITYDDNGVLRFNQLFAAEAIAARMRLAFARKRSLSSTMEIMQKTAQLLVVEKLQPIPTATTRLYPDADDVTQIVEMDASGQSACKYLQEKTEQREAAQKLLREQGFANIQLPPLQDVSVPVLNKDRSLHYAPYRFDSSFESEFLSQALTFEALRERDLEIYFNGEGELTEFRIQCFARAKNGWSVVGLYSPDFLIVQRKDGAIYRALIIETKGEGYAQSFVPRRRFVETEFLRFNNQKFGYRRFDFLYLEGAMNEETRFALESKVKEFFAA